MRSVPKETYPFEIEIVKKTISMLPQDWNEAVLKFYRDDRNQLKHWGIEFYESDNPDVAYRCVTPDFDLMSFILKLGNKLLELNIQWEEVVFKIFLKENGNWGFKINYSYFK